MVTVKYFASLKGIAGKEEDRFDLDGETTLNKLIEMIGQTSPKIGEMAREKKVLVSINCDIADLDARVQDGDEIALLPPFSGGCFQG